MTNKRSTLGPEFSGWCILVDWMVALHIFRALLATVWFAPRVVSAQSLC